MTHCVNIDGHFHLYLYGDHRCYSYWQYLIMYGVLPVILLFPIAFGISLNLLKGGLISSKTFLLASVAPIYAIWLWVKNKTTGLNEKIPSMEEKVCIEAILEMEELLFRAEDSLLQWPIVQLYRNYLVVVLNNFILNPIYRTISFILVFLFFLVHEFIRMPYKHHYLNLLQCLSSICLCAIAACNIPASMSVMTNSMSVPQMKFVVLMLQYVEMAIYALVPSSLLVWKVWERYMDYQEIKKKVI